MNWHDILLERQFTRDVLTHALAVWSKTLSQTKIRARIGRELTSELGARRLATSKEQIVHADDLGAFHQVDPIEAILEHLIDDEAVL